MQSTGHSSIHALSLTSTHGCAITYVTALAFLICDRPDGASISHVSGQDPLSPSPDLRAYHGPVPEIRENHPEPEANDGGAAGAGVAAGAAGAGAGFRPAGGGVAREMLSSLPIGTRVVVRYRIEGGFTDAVGELRDSDGRTVSLTTRRGVATIELSSVAAARRVPPPLPRRRPRAAG